MLRESSTRNGHHDEGDGGREDADLALELGAGLAHQLGVVDQAVLRGVVLGLQRLGRGVRSQGAK